MQRVRAAAGRIRRLFRRRAAVDAPDAKRRLGDIDMHNMGIAIENQPRRRIAAAICLATGTLMIAAYARLSSADAAAGPETFASVQQAAGALYVAVRNDDEDALTRILGAGKDTVLSSDPAQDRVDRDQFVEKYREMHRIVHEPDGSDVLYVGAENWPFPFPLIADNGAWHFDSDAGVQQLLLRRIGANELAAIATCRALAARAQQVQSIDRPAALPVGAADAARVANADDGGVPVHGYYFRELRDAPPSNDNTVVRAPLRVIAYPERYQVTGVMTFAVDGDGIMYEGDLGSETVPFAKQLRDLDPTLTWQIVP